MSESETLARRPETLASWTLDFGVPGFPKLRSFAQELVDLGVPQGATKRICKQVVLKTLEVHGAMIRSYYAAKFNPTTVDFSSSFKDAHLVHKILQKP